MIAARQLPRRDAHHTPRRPARTRVRVVARRRALGLLRAGVILAVPFALVMAYVSLTANLTSLGYKVARASAAREVLRAETSRLDDRIAQLQSPERLAQIAQALGMHDPHRYAVVRLPEAPAGADRPHRIALLSTVTDWLKPR